MKAPKSKAGLQLFPEIQELTKGLGTLAMGHVQRLTLQFKTRFWEGLSEKPISFLHAGPEHFFPTWWTQVPVRSPFLIAWQGGPRAQFLSAQSKEYRLEEALKTLAKITGKRKTSLREQLLNSFSHDWTQDPFSLGAYSYTGVQSQNNLARLRKPFSKTILLAGEATAESTAQGTVHGAMESGLRAAKQLEALLNG
jgi:monoamine oxidase